MPTHRPVRLLVTGSSGFIGAHLADQLGARHSVAAPRRGELDLLDEAAVRAYLEQQPFDVVVHAATERSTRQHPNEARLLHRNLRMFFNLARCRRAYGRLLFLSS